MLTRNLLRYYCVDVLYIENLYRIRSHIGAAMMKKIDFETQNLAKNCNEALILSILASGPRHGYQLALELEEKSGGYFSFNHGTLYPILHKLEKDGLIKGSWSREESRRKKKKYSITVKGEDYLKRQMKSWKGFFDRFFKITGEAGS